MHSRRIVTVQASQLYAQREYIASLPSHAGAINDVPKAATSVRVQ